MRALMHATQIAEEDTAKKLDDLENHLGIPRSTLLTTCALHLNLRSLGDYHAPAIAHIVQSNPRLEELELSRNKMSGAG